MPNEAMVVGREAYELYDVDSLPLPPNLRDPMTDKPNIYRREQQIFAGVSDDEWRAAKACYLGRITEIDAELGRLLALLREHDALESTIVVAIPGPAVKRLQLHRLTLLSFELPRKLVLHQNVGGLKVLLDAAVARNERVELQQLLLQRFELLLL